MALYVPATTARWVLIRRLHGRFVVAKGLASLLRRSALLQQVASIIDLDHLDHAPRHGRIQLPTGLSASGRATAIGHRRTRPRTHQRRSRRDAGHAEDHEHRDACAPRAGRQPRGHVQLARRVPCVRARLCLPAGHSRCLPAAACPDTTPLARAVVAITATAEDGRTIVGVGESDANPWIMRECVNTFGTHVVGLGIKQMLLGENALEIERLWSKMYAGTYMNGRRGVRTPEPAVYRFPLVPHSGIFLNRRGCCCLGWHAACCRSSCTRWERWRWRCGT